MEAPRTAVHVARAQLAVVAAIVIAGLVGGVGIQLELWAPGPAWSIERYTAMLGVHGLLAFAVGAPVLAGSFGYVAVTAWLGVRRVVAPAIAWVGLGLWALGVGAIVVLLVRTTGRGDPGWTFATPTTVEPGPGVIARALGPLACAAATLVFALHLGAQIAPVWRAARPGPRAAAAAFALVLAAAALAALADACGLAATGGIARVLTVGAALLLACAAVARDVRDRTVLAFVALGVVPMFAVAQLSRWVGGASDVHLTDTYFAVGTYHALAAVIAFACLAAVHAWAAPLVGRVPQPVVAAIGAVACCAGMLLHVYASLRLGLGGMPRRYWDYEPPFAALHQLAGVGAAIAIGGLVLLTAAWLLTARRTAR